MRVSFFPIRKTAVIQNKGRREESSSLPRPVCLHLKTRIQLLPNSLAGSALSAQIFQPSSLSHGKSLVRSKLASATFAKNAASEDVRKLSMISTLH